MLADLNAAIRRLVDELNMLVMRGYLWALARDDRPWGGEDPPGVVYFYAPGRAGENAQTFLTGFDGILQVDGYTGYNRLTKLSRKGGTPITFRSGWNSTL